MPRNTAPETERYVMRIWIAAAIYACPLMLKIVLPDALASQPVVSASLTFLPIVGMIGFFYAMHRLVAELSDEYQRHLMVETYQLATWLVLSATTIAGFQQLDDRVANLPLFVVPILWFACFAIAAVWVRWRANRPQTGE